MRKNGEAKVSNLATVRIRRKKEKRERSQRVIRVQNSEEYDFSSYVSARGVQNEKRREEKYKSGRFRPRGSQRPSMYYT